uniref:Coatomer subunit beta n=2 Tax=Hordeum vulgare subsp. vulgare TaxID=112509 RepID=A0A8I6XK42_HORVV
MAIQACRQSSTLVRGAVDAPHEAIRKKLRKSKEIRSPADYQSIFSAFSRYTGGYPFFRLPPPRSTPQAISSVADLGRGRSDLDPAQRPPTMSEESPCTFLVPLDKSCLSTAEEIKADLEGSDVGAKVDALKRAITLLLNGDTIPHLLVTVVRYVLPSKEHIIQRLLLLYLEVVDKRDEAFGKVSPEMTLISHKLRNNLQHPNEYIRGVTLRVLCRLREPELLEPLLPAVIANLKHPHPFVRRHVFSAISAIYRLRDGQLLPHVPCIVERALAIEQDPTARRNAFLVLCDCSKVQATLYLLINAAGFTEWPDPLQMAALDFFREVCVKHPYKNHQSHLFCHRYIEVIISFLSTGSSSTAVMYHCACTLLSVSHTPNLLKAAAKTYCQLLNSQRDSKVKLIILDRLHELCISHRYMMVNFVMDILGELASPDLDIKKKVLDLVLGLLTPQNVGDVVFSLKEEVYKLMGSLLEFANEYYQMLLQAIHACAVVYPKVVGPVVNLLLGFLGYGDVASASDVVLFMREVIETKPYLRFSIIQGLIGRLYEIKDSFICSCALWILGEYSLSLVEVEGAISTIKESLGDQPFYAVSEKSGSIDSSKPDHPAMDSSTLFSKRLLVALLNGTSARQSAATDDSIVTPALTSGLFDSSYNLRFLIMSGDFHLAAVVACTLTKLVLRLEVVQPSKIVINNASAESLLIMVSILQLGNCSYLPHPIDSDSYDRIVFCIRLLCSTDDHARKVWLLSGRQSFTKMVIAEKQFMKNEKMKVKAHNAHAHPDDSIDFYHLRSKRELDQLVLEDEVRCDLMAATGEVMKGTYDANKLIL